MRTIVWTLCLLLFLSLSAQETIPVSAVKPGMTGYGLSVFRGHKIERFDVEVIDILHRALPKQDLILIHCKPAYGGFDLDSSGLIAGMSGSPIYLDGKLAGALSYGWEFAKETIAGVTPIANMLSEVERPLEKRMAQRTLPTIGSLRPLRSPLLVSGATARSFAEIDDMFSDYGFVPIQGGGAGEQVEKSDGKRKLVPGGSIGAQLMAGDLDITAIGTVTWVEGEKVLAFGHPFFNVGEFFVPITTARIAMVMKSRSLSFKMGSPVERIGSMVQDRPSGIYGKMGKMADTLPLTVKIENKITHSGHTFHVDVARHSYITPQLCTVAIYNFLDTQEAVWGDNTTWIHSKIYLEGRDRPIENDNIGVSRYFYAGQILKALPYLYQSPYDIPKIQRIEVEIALSHELQEAAILGLKVSPPRVSPGEEVQLQVSLHPYREQRKMVPMRLCIPPDTPPGQYTVVVAGGGKNRPDVAIPEDAKEYLDFLQQLDRYKNNHLVAMVSLPRFKVVCRGHEMPELPSTIFGSLLSGNDIDNIQLLIDQLVATHSTAYALSGSSKVFIEVKEEK